MNNIETIGQISELVRLGVTDFRPYGNVNAKFNEDGLVLFNYNEHCQFENRWNFFERVSRGLILDVYTGEVVARPFDKFFNWGERSTDAKLIEATEKMDGSLGIMYRVEGKYRVATRGSFDSDQAIWATEWLNTHHNLSLLSDSYTFLFEIVYPANRVVVDYNGFEGLFLLGIRKRHNGNDLPFSIVKNIADQYGFSTPLTYDFSSVQDVLAAAAKLSTNAEGWVLRFADGQRFKVKGDAYKIAHKLMTGVTFSRVLEAVASGDLDSMIAGVPDEFLVNIRQYRDQIEETTSSIIATTYELLQQAPKSSRKEFAIWVTRNVPDYQAYLFAAFDGKPVLPLVYKHAFKDRAND